ncbi:MAG: DUF3025 domain-containing protein [Myxococcales bacterium]|nr:DUF3025 domain-containing protein [Polyangiaceae bacterium]MDW8250575.1 DUF3025 domain-containing protein [Myxococcales bacterium]
MKLRLVRRPDSPFDGRFFERDPRLWPIVEAALAFVDHLDWPEPEAYLLAFRGRPAPVRFLRDTPRRRPRGHPIDLDALYDARIVRGIVPTRPRNWHDFLNALVWATFPRAKVALHRRQHELIRAWIPPGATALPNARTPAQDTLALLDEGGILWLRDGNKEALVPFGHGLLEGIVLGVPAMVPRAFVLTTEWLPQERRTLLALADGLLADALEGEVKPVPINPRALFSFLDNNQVLLLEKGGQELCGI